jgi:glycerol kinase
VAHLTRAALEAVAYQSLDLAEAMAADGAAKPAALRVDGGMTANSWLCQFLANILQCPVERPRTLETTALGAAFHAGLATGLWSDLDALSKISVPQDSFQPSMDADRRATLIAGWKTAVERVLTK